MSGSFVNSGGSSPSHNHSSGKDFIAELDSVRHEEEWSWTIIGAMARIQSQYAIERNIENKLPKDYFTDADKLKFFWSGLTNSSSVKTFFDLLIRSIVNWEIILLLFAMVLAQVFIFSTFENKPFIPIAIFACTYFSIVGYSLYIASCFKYFVYGDLSARMMFMLMMGRIVFLLISATVLSAFIFFIVTYFENNPKELYGWSSGLYWILNVFEIAHDWLGTKEQFYTVMYQQVLPELRATGKEMLSVFTLFGLLPLVLMLTGKAFRSIRIARETRTFNKGE